MTTTTTVLSILFFCTVLLCCLAYVLFGDEKPDGFDDKRWRP